MPNVIGLQVQSALAYMVAAGVRVLPLGYFQTDPVTMSWLKTTQRPGFVISQTPAFGTSMQPNAPAVLIVSSYPVAVSTDGSVVSGDSPGGYVLDEVNQPFILDKSRLG
ncbi:PASTA domain-containing protein [Burkholderia metallica]|uniref:PASTA domain-containing protein n=1 Tax=Burkholderia metallica TaxID=488729 RepID=UPI0021F4A030|nr:PASTA domain-containing protein [Burkholderia metallica]